MGVRDPQTFIGFRKGRFVVVSFEGREEGSGRMLFKCKCDCGEEFTARQNNLNRNTNSCGCLRRELSSENSMRDAGDVISRKILNQCIRSDRKRGLTCNLSLGVVRVLIFSPCHYCGTEPVHKRSLWRRVSQKDNLIAANGIDRVNNKIGYEKSNCVPCCTRCNIMKRDMNKDQFIELLRKIVGRHT